MEPGLFKACGITAVEKTLRMWCFLLMICPMRQIYILALVFAGLSAQAAPLTREEAPAPLREWVSWVLRGYERQVCPFFNGRGNSECSWPGVLKLSLDENGGRFEQSWRVHAESRVRLPGGEQWPQEVRVDGAPAVVGAGPSVLLKPGTHAVSGIFSWKRLPEQLEVPAETGLLALTVRGQAAAFPPRDDAGRLWLQSRAQPVAMKEQSHLEVSVHRRLIDEVPAQLVTRIQLKVSGANREERLSRALPEGFSPMSLISPLPARLDADGRLRVQARAGTWDLLLVSRREGPGDDIRLPKAEGAWDLDEAWVFEARPELRQSELEGVPALDPQQTELPMDWRSLPAYLVRPGDALRLTQRRRGDDPPTPDRLALTREIWLDFDGGGYSARDRVSGTLGKSWRLEASPETKLGRVAEAGLDQFLTALSSGGPAGLEVRTRQVQVEADSRVEGRLRSAAGWRHDFESVGAVLHLPPGWRAFHIGGADQASPTWVSTWTLLDFFLVLVAAAAFLRVYGPRWGAAGLAGLALSWHEAGAPRWTWIVILAVAALHQALTGTAHASFQRWTGYARRGVWLALAMLLLPFFVQQIRQGMYPALEFPYQTVEPGQPSRAAEPEQEDDAAAQAAGGGGMSLVRSSPKFRGTAGPRGEVAARRGGVNAGDAFSRTGSALSGLNAAAQEQIPEGAEEGEEEEDSEADQKVGGGLFGSGGSPYEAAKKSKMASLSFYSSVVNQMRLDPNARVSTGPGMPMWSWRSVRLTWKGPMPQDHRVRLWLLSPGVNFLLALLRVGLLAALALLAGGWQVGAWLETLRDSEGRRRAARAILPLLLLSVLLPAGAAAQQFPPKEMLEDLRGRLLEKPECGISCADIPRLQVTATGGWLTLRLDVHAAAATAVPVPSGGREWLPSKATLDGAPATLRRVDDGSLWAPVPAGAHSLILEGPLPERDTVQIGLPLKPRRVTSSVAGWVLNGVRDDGRSEDNLQLSRSRGAESAAAAAATARAQGIFPPFLRVERVVRLGLSWTVETQVTRLTPPGTPVVVQIPLLPGESVTAPELRAVGGKVTVNIAPQAMSFSWTSVLKEAKALALASPASVPWTDSWRVEPGPLWHVQASGLAPIYEEARPGPRSLTFRPRPGETVSLDITRPAAVAGQTLTVDQSVLTLKPGVRATDAALALTLRSSRGDRQILTLPEGSELLGVRIDGATNNLRLEGRRLTVPVTPGAHTVDVDWRLPGGARLFYRTPETDLGAPSVNSHVRIEMPAGRWTLLLGGRGLGPAVLFWSMLAVFLMVSVGLGKTGVTPLTWKHWFLLSLGLTQLSPMGGVIVAGWFVVVGLRGAYPPAQKREFNLTQVFLAVLTAAAAVYLFLAIKRGLLGAPDMQISGNGSGSHLLRWYLDRSGPTLPRPWVLSVPLFIYRAGMLFWALWLADALTRWVRWAWDCSGKGGLWRGKTEP